MLKVQEAFWSYFFVWGWKCIKISSRRPSGATFFCLGMEIRQKMFQEASQSYLEIYYY